MASEKNISVSRHGFNSIKDLVVDSINLFEKTALQLILVWVTIIALIVGLMIIFGLFGFILFGGAFSNLIMTGNLPTISPLSIIIGVILAFLLAVAIIVFSAIASIAPVLIVGEHQKNINFRQAIKSSLPLIIPFYLTSLLSGLLLFGGFWFGILPALLFVFLFIFTNYEVILGKRRYYLAIRKSAMIVFNNFGPILVRLLILLGIYFLLIGIPSALAGDSKSFGGILVGIYSSIINIFLSLFSVCYLVNVYKQASYGLEDKEPAKYNWIWLISLIGWLLFFLFIFVIAKFAGEMINNINKNPYSPDSKLVIPMPSLRPEPSFQPMPNSEISLPEEIENYGL